MRRREFIALAGGTAVWPLAARAQRPEPTGRIGVHLPTIGIFGVRLGKAQWP